MRFGLPESAITIASHVGTLVDILTFDAPVLSGAIGANGPTTGGSILTARGMQLAMLDLSPTAAISITPCMSTGWTSTTSVRCSVRTAYGIEHFSVITVSSLLGTIFFC